MTSLRTNQGALTICLKNEFVSVCSFFKWHMPADPQICDPYGFSFRPMSVMQDLTSLVFSVCGVTCRRFGCGDGIREEGLRDDYLTTVTISGHMAREASLHPISE
ncbi:hypothetical protein TNCV_2266981 [Trichonephila clavipes]|nr:hypothetical protein TNCV_2266981 [Trichonephila clavipes]